MFFDVFSYFKNDIFTIFEKVAIVLFESNLRFDAAMSLNLYENAMTKT